MLAARGLRIVTKAVHDIFLALRGLLGPGAFGRDVSDLRNLLDDLLVQR